MLSSIVLPSMIDFTEYIEKSILTNASTLNDYSGRNNDQIYVKIILLMGHVTENM